MGNQAWTINVSRILLILVISMGLACERDTKLIIEGGTPPKFVMSGNGSLRGLMVRGPKKQREAMGEDASVYWRIKSLEGGALSVEDIGTIIYGIVPDGYEQIYPENGKAPPLIDGEKYYIRINTANANGAQKYFTMNNGSVEVISL